MTTSELTSSEQSLTFPKTIPGKPVFLVLRVTTDEKDGRVTASTDLPAVFQLASDARPIFGAMLSLAYEPSGTYVHIRYQPDRAGLHEGTLTLQSAVGTRTVALTGRCSRIAATHTNANKVLTQIVASREANSTTQRTGKLIAGAAVVVALLYTGVTYRCQLLPSLCRQDASVGSQPVVRSTLSTVGATASVPVPERTAAVEPITERAVPEAADRSRQERVRTSAEGRTRRSARVAEPTQTAEVKPSLAANQSATRSVVTKPVRVEKPRFEPVRPAKPAAETEESDLERELNGRTNQNR
ncbi:hypothetical protein [uncultured Spirosoma sp.]|uniref:hypothetical protein n=1 Tax=uncultured Spirosoma sp. TaxID=278208 RepID=UPI0025852725|nr:hypothetical protein [uncultured Spirosoma sp.]